MRRILAGISAISSGVEPQWLGVERRIALGLGAERVKARGEVAVGAERLQQRRGGLHGLQQLFVGGERRGVRPRRACSTVAAAAAAAAAGAGTAGAGPSSTSERGEDAVVEAELALQVLLDPRPRKRPDSAPWITRWS